MSDHTDLPAGAIEALLPRLFAALEWMDALDDRALTPWAGGRAETSWRLAGKPAQRSSKSSIFLL